MNGTSRDARGFTLVELLVVISVLGIILAFFIPTIVGRVTANARRVATLQELRMLRDAIVGDPDVRMGGDNMVLVGFKSDVGRLPRDLIELVMKNPFDPPGSGRNYPNKETLPNWDPYIKKGWNGPYVRQDPDLGYITDSWGNEYKYYVVGTETLGLESAGPDGIFIGQPGWRDSDDVVVMF